MYSTRGKMISVLVATVIIAVVMFVGVIPSSAQVNHTPTAYIDSISPSPVAEGEAVLFRGHGTDTDDHPDRVVGYEWISNIDGQLSESQTFVTRDLSIGVHTIQFRVRDTYGLWSEPVWQTLVVGPIGADGDWDYWTNQPNLFSIPTGNIGIGTEEPTYKLDVRGEIISLVGPDKCGVLIGADSEKGEIKGIQKKDSYWLARDLLINPHPFSRVGIGATSPEAKLHIDAGMVETALDVDDTLYVAGRKVGIGMMIPENKLHVNGAINLDPVPEPPAPSTGFVIYVDEDSGQLKAKSSQGTVTVLATP